MTNSKVKNGSGYFKVPDLIFDLSLSPNARLVLTYFCRRSDKSGYCFPSQARICNDTGIKSENTVRKAIKELEGCSLVRKLSPAKNGGSNRYILADWIIELTKGKYREVEGEPPSDFEPPNIDEHDTPPSNFTYPPSKFESNPHQNLRTKEYTEKENINKENNPTIKNARNVFDCGEKLKKNLRLGKKKRPRFNLLAEPKTLSVPPHIRS